MNNPFKRTLTIDLECRNAAHAASLGEQVDAGCFGCPGLQVTTLDNTSGETTVHPALIDEAANLGGGAENAHLN